MSTRGFPNPLGAPASAGPGIWSPIGSSNLGHPVQFPYAGIPPAHPAPGIRYQPNIPPNVPLNIAMAHQPQPFGHCVSHILMAPYPPQPAASPRTSSIYPPQIETPPPFQPMALSNAPTLQSPIPPPVSSVPSPILPRTVTFDAHQSAKVCSYCQKTHSRPVRYMACENKYTGIRPFVCGGRCGDATCTAAFHSKERLTHHLRSDEDTHVRCEHCGKAGWKQNAARHERSCHGGSPNYAPGSSS